MSKHPHYPTKSDGYYFEEFNRSKKSHSTDITYYFRAKTDIRLFSAIVCCKLCSSFNHNFAHFFALQS